MSDRNGVDDRQTESGPTGSPTGGASDVTDEQIVDHRRIDTGSRVVAPLILVSTGPRVIGRLEPVFEVEGEEYALHTAEMAAIPSALLRGQPIADLTGSDYEIRGALDMVFSGF